MLRRVFLFSVLICCCSAVADQQQLPQAVLKAQATGKYVFLNRMAYSGPEIEGQPKRALVLSFMDVDCPPCRKELPLFDQVAQSLKKEPGIKFYIVSTDSLKRTQDLESLVQKLALKTEVLRDPYKVFAGKLGIKGLPTVIVVARDGVIQHTHQGYDGNAKKYQESLGKWVSGLLVAESKGSPEGIDRREDVHAALPASDSEGEQ